MSKPNSLTTQLRRMLASIIEPHPDSGEAWCVDCSMNEARTLVIQFENVVPHLQGHVNKGDNTHVQMIGWNGERKGKK